MIKNPIVWPKKRANGFKNRVGEKYGRLTVTEYAGSEVVATAPKIKYKSLWKATCTCGKSVIVRGNSLTSKTRSCGCLSRETTAAFNKRTKTKMSYDTFSAVWQSYKKGAKDRKLSFNLNKDEFYALTQGNCHYCGAAPAQVRKPRVKNKLASFIYNGIDRVDSALGYSVENCVTCCGRCNKMKLDLPLSVFVGHLLRIIQHLNLTPNALQSKL